MNSSEPETWQQALRTLPHGPEFRFLNRIMSLDAGRTGSAEYTLTGDETFLRGHFPGQPIMPGVLLIEGAAQLAGVVAQSDPQFEPMPGLKLTAVNQAKIRGMAVPGETITFEARVLARMANLVQVSVIARVGDRPLLQGEVALSGEAPPRARKLS